MPIRSCPGVCWYLLVSVSMNETDFRVSGTITKYGDSGFLFDVHLRNLGAVGEMLAVTGNAVPIRVDHRVIGDDPLIPFSV
jgi:hypothetical protein